ncbi:MAG: hypothetical protein AAF678_03265 [Pseudomonadota bacterium]
MSRTRWHIERAEDRVLLTRRVPARFDVAACTDLPALRLMPLVHMVRQDIWRALRGLRGFAPVVEAHTVASGVQVKAGGQVSGRMAREQIETTLRMLLEDAPTRARWIRCAR